jgi:predicted permease
MVGSALTRAGVYGREAVRAARRLVARPVFTAVAVLTVAFAIAPGVVFHLVDRAVLPPLPYDHPEELVAIWQRASFGRVATSIPKLALLRERSRTLEIAAQRGAMPLFLASKGHHKRVLALFVTPSFFSVLGARPQIGRLFGEDEDRVPLGHPVVVLSDAFWRRQFDARPDVIGERIVLNDVSFTVMGVARPEFRGYSGVVMRWRGLESEDVWAPSTMAPLAMVPEWRNARSLEASDVQIWGALGRMRPGYGLREVRAEMDLLGAEVRRIWPEQTEMWPVPFEAVPLVEDAVDPKILRTVSLLGLAGGLVTLLGALNLGSMLLARGVGRERSIAVERALGASRSALVWGRLSEAVIIGALGAAVALLLTRVAIAGLGRVEPAIVANPFGVSLDRTSWQWSWTAAAWAMGVGLAVALGGGLAAAWKAAHGDSAALLRTAPGAAGPGLRGLRPARARGLLIAFEVALAVALTLPALLLVRSAGRLVTADLGFRSSGVSTTTVALPSAEYEPPRAATFTAQALAQLRKQPGVTSAGWISTLPLSGSFSSLLARAGTRAGGVAATVHVASPEALATHGIPLIEGRDFAKNDRPDSPRVVVLSELAARRLSVGIGARVDVPALGVQAAEVVGVAGNVPYRDPASSPIPAVYLPLAQSPQTEGTLVVRSARRLEDVGVVVRGVLMSLDGGLERPVTEPLSSLVDRRMARFRAASWLLAAAALIALILSGTGVYGVLSAIVARAVPEIGVRLALGATPAKIRRQIVLTTMLLGSLGLGLGIPLGLAGVGPLQSYLYGVHRWDVWTVLLASATTTAVALAGAWSPARRAMRVDPMAALRSME